jgi:pimeloyl-ACP methyl ester carboxylesterase
MPKVETNGARVYYERHGEGQPIVCAPGGGWDHRSWYPQVEGLKDEFELILYDPRGHGKTTYSGRDDISVELLADDMGVLVDELELENPAVMGCSMGGLIAHAYAADNPADVGALITIEAPTGMTDVPLPMRVMQRIQLVGSRFVSLDRIYAFQRWIGSLFGEGDKWADQNLPGLEMTKDEYVDDSVSEVDAEVMVRMGSILQYEPSGLDAISAPTLVLTGAEPDEFFADAAKELVEEIPDARWERIPDSGHGAHIDNPQTFNDTVRGFLNETLSDREQVTTS